MTAGSTTQGGRLTRSFIFLAISAKAIYRKIFPARFAIPYPFLCRALRQLVDPEEMQQYTAKTAKKLDTILTHAAAGGPVRVWSSNRPDEVCGFYWLMEHLSRLKENCGPVSMIQLPKDAFDKDGTLLGTWGMVYSSDRKSVV